MATADGFPEGVAPDELIESSWGNEVVSTLDAIAVYNNVPGRAGSRQFLRIIASDAIVATNGLGQGTIAFPVGFSAAPMVTANVMDPVATGIMLGILATGTPINGSGFSFQVNFHDGGPIVGSVRIGYIAIGAR